MPGIRPRVVTGKDYVVIPEETINILQKTSVIREAEKSRIRVQVEELEQQIKDLSVEYTTFLNILGFVDEGTDPMTFVPHTPISELYDEAVADGATYVDTTQVLVNNPTIPSMNIVQTEADTMLGKLSSEILWYQNELNKKFSLKKMFLKRLYDIEYRENPPSE